MARFLLILLFLGGGLLEAQDTTYFDRHWEDCKPEDQYFYRMPRWTGEVWEFKTYFSSNDKLQRLAYFGSRRRAEGFIDPPDAVGNWKYWYENGQLDLEMLYRDGNILYINSWDSNGVACVVNGNGTYSSFDPGGDSKIELTIKDSLLNGKCMYYYRQGDDFVLGQVIHFFMGEADGPYQEFYPNGQLRKEGEKRGGRSIGDWTWYKPSGKVLDRHRFDGSPEAEQAYEERDLFVPARVLNFEDVIGSMYLPPAASLQGIYGLVLIEVKLSKKGKVVDTVVLQSPHALLTKAALERIKDFKFKGATWSGEPWEDSFTLPFNFSKPK